MRWPTMELTRRHLGSWAASSAAHLAWAGPDRPDRPAMVAVPQDVWDDHRSFLNGRAPQSIAFFGGPGARRDVVELVLVQQARHRGGGREGLLPLNLPTDARLLHDGYVGSSAS